LAELSHDLEVWSKNSTNEINVITEKSSSLLINFNTLAPSLKLKYIHDELITRAKQNGIAMVGINNSAGIHTLSFWTYELTKRNMIGLCFFNGGPLAVIPHNGTKGLFGTNPMSYAIPTENEPILIDMATSEIPYFELKESKRDKKDLKQFAAVDDNGEFTTDPNLSMNDDGISNLTPMGAGYKGYSIVLLLEILTGSLVVSLLSNEMDPDYIPSEHGGLLIAIDIESFTEIGKFKKSVSGLCDVIRSQKSKAGEEIYIPGDISYKKIKAVFDSSEIEVEQNIIDSLNNLINE